MARKLNTRLLLYVLIFVGVPLGLVLFGLLEGWFSGGDPEQFYQKAQEAFEQEEHAQAWIHIRDAAKAGGGQDPEIMHLMGDIALKQTPPAVGQAIQAYRATVHLKPDHVDAQRKLTELYVAVRYWQEALTEAKRLQELDPSYGRAYLWEARAHMGLAEAEPIQSRRTPLYEKAAGACETGLDQDPNLLPLYSVLAHIYQRLERPEKVEQVVNLAMENNPEEAEAYLLKSSLLMSEDRTEEAIKTLEKGLETVGPDADLYVALGEAAVREPDLDAAKKYFAGAIEGDPTAEKGYLRLAGIHRIEAEREKAVEVLGQGIDQIPDSVSLLAQQADIYLEMGDRQNADAIIKRLEEVGAEGKGMPGSVEFLKGKRALLTRQVRQAITFLEQARDKQEGPRPRLLLGRAYLLAGELGAAEKTLQDLVDAYPGLTPAWRTLTEVELRLRQFDRAARAARVVLQRHPGDTETRLHLARALLFQNNAERALQVTGEAAKNAPEDPDPLLLTATIQEQMGRKDEAEKTYRKAVEVAKDDPNVYRRFLQFYQRTNQNEKLQALLEEVKTALPEDSFFAVSGTSGEIEKQLQERVASDKATASDYVSLGNLYAGTDRPDEAQKAYEAALAKAEPTAAAWRTAWQRLFLLHLSRDQFGEAAELVQQLKTSDPDAPELLFADPLLLLSQNKFDEATEMLRKVIAEHPSLSQGHFMLAQVLASRGKWEAAMAALNKTLEARPNLVPAHLMLARIYRRRGNFTGVLSEAEEALRFNPGLVQALELKASGHAGLGEWKQALETRRRIAEIVPENVDNLVSLAALHVQQHQPDEAERVFQRAYELAPDNALLVQAYADFCAETKRVEQGAKIVDAYVEKHPDKAEAYVMRGEFTSKVASPEKAEPYFRKAAELSPDDPYPLVFLGDRYSAVGRWSKAAEAYREAVGRGEDSSLARKRLADVYMLQDKLDEARSIIDKVVQADPDDAAALVVAGRIAAHQGKGEEAERLFQKALELNPTYGEARVRLAELHAGPDPLKALDILSEVDPSDRSFEKAQLLRADINTRRVQLTEAILDLRRLLDFRPTSVPGRLQLAWKYMATEEYGRAAELLEQLSRERLDKDVSLLVALGEARMKQENYKAALQAFEKARKVEPESSEALTGEVRALVALGRVQDALDRAHEAMNKWPKEVWPRMALVAVYKETGQLQKAFDTLRTGLLARPEWEQGYVYLADLLVRADRKPEARQVLVTGLQKVPSSVSVRAGLAALEIGAGGAERAAKILQPLAKEFEAKYSRMPDRLPDLRPYMPSIRIYSLSLYRSGRIEEALKWGMRLWSLDPTDVANANNMAWILATEKEDYDRARDLISRCMRLVPNHPQVLDTAGWIEFLDGRYEDAIENFLASIKYGDNAEARYHLGRAYEASRRQDEAREEYKKALEMGLGGDDKADAQRRLEQLATAAG
ncbi:MAG: tetratricopeptide repeat protein [Phycisphaerae bacterium]